MLRAYIIISLKIHRVFLTKYYYDEFYKVKIDGFKKVLTKSKNVIKALQTSYSDPPEDDSKTV
jgi:hypothetical protein